MGAIKPVGSQGGQRVRIVRGKVDEIAIPCRSNIPGERVRNLEVHVLDSAQRLVNIFFESHLQAVVYRTPDGKQHLVCAGRTEVDATKGCVRTWASPAEGIAGIQAIGREVVNRRLVGAIDP